ncbi:MAG: hypothetical protein ISR51_00175 [Rhodospirillales bacterium]|nr:hypothetical protein [Alphaproteobacteria bacterium]MBL6947065.1 hypothetical protein [Rhodospirillales bacterium]
MAEVAPLNYERWALIVSPMVTQGGLGVPPGYEARHTEQLVQISPSLGRLDSRARESLVEQTLKPPESHRKAKGLERKRPAPPLTSHPAGLVLRQPLPREIFTSAGNLPVPLPQTVAELYTPPETPHHASVDVTG